MTGDQRLGSAIREIRTAAGMSQEDLADALSDLGLTGFYPQTITKIEQGKRALKFEEGMAITTVFGVSAELLLSPAEFNHDDRQLMRRVRELEAAHHRAIHTFGEVREAAANLSVYAAEAADASEATLREAQNAIVYWGPGITAGRIGILARDDDSPKATR